MGIRRAWIERNRALEDASRFLVLAAVEDRHAEQMYGLKKFGQLGNHAPAKRLRVRMPAFTVGGDRSQQRLEVLPDGLLPLRFRDGARAGVGLQRNITRAESLSRV